MNKLLFWLYLILLLVLSLMPSEQLPESIFTIWDKVQHALGFLVLAALGLRAYPGQRPQYLVCAMLGFGGLMELAQAATGWRNGDWADLLADGVGIGLALLAWQWLPRRITGP